MPKVTLKAIVPKSKQRRGEISPKAIDRGLRRTASRIRQDMKETTHTWARQPEFTVVAKSDRIEVATEDKIWGYLNDGTPAHIISARKPNGRLAFRLGGRAKTRPGVIRAGAGAAANGKLVFPRSVRHPGIQARRWTQVIAKRRAVTLQQEISQAMAEIARNEG